MKSEEEFSQTALQAGFCLSAPPLCSGLKSFSQLELSQHSGMTALNFTSMRTVKGNAQRLPGNNQTIIQWICEHSFFSASVKVEAEEEDEEEENSCAEM